MLLLGWLVLPHVYTVAEAMEAAAELAKREELDRRLEASIDAFEIALSGRREDTREL